MPFEPKPKVVIVIGGGCLRGVFSSFPDIEVQVIDTDNLLADKWRNSSIDDFVAGETDALYPNHAR